jgi:Leucine-rich repeat (LRR) protein
MRKIYIPLIAIFLLFGKPISVLAQDADSTINTTPAEYAQQARELAAYLEGTLNFLGDPEATVQEKEIVINESYGKMFRDAEVQIEDDLDEARMTAISKDVQAYLKDIDFFFTEARFTFDIQKVEQMTSENGETYFKVSLMRRLEATTIRNEKISNSRQRYLEVNLDPVNRDLKIVSYYTTRINERAELAYWWSTMASEWKEFFGAGVMVLDNIPITSIKNLTNDAIIMDRLHSFIRNDSFMVVDIDTLPLSDLNLLHGHRPDTVIWLNDTAGVWMPDTIPTNVSEVYSRLKQFTKTPEINISYKFQFIDLEPLSELTELKLIDCSNTLIADLSPLRNLNQLDAIYFSGTQVFDLTPLQYSVNIKEIYCFNTLIDNLNVLAGFKQLEKLYCFNTRIATFDPISEMTTLQSIRASNTKIKDIKALANLTALQMLDISNTEVSDISPLKNLTALEVLNLDQTKVTSLEAISGLKELTTIQFNNTAVNSLMPLNGLTKLQKVYCEKTGITTEMATTFMRQHPDCMVIYETEELNAWWKNLPIYWKAIFSEQAGVGAVPNSEELHTIINLSKLDLTGNKYLQNLEPLGRLINLHTLLLSKTEITDLEPIATLNELKFIDISQTRISSLDGLKSLDNLEYLNISNTRVENLDPLVNLTHLRLVEADGSRLTQAIVTGFRFKQPETLVVFQTDALKAWWNNLPQDWKDLFATYQNLDVNPTSRQLQAIVDIKEIEIKEYPAINSIAPLSKLVSLEYVYLKGTGVSDLSPLSGLKFLKRLAIPGNPVSNLQPLSVITSIEMLNIEDTPVIDLTALSSLTNLRVLNAGGTPIKSLKALAPLSKLEELSVNNTAIKSLSPADVMPSLKQLKCFNTKIKSKAIAKLKTTRPGLNVIYY